MAATTLGLGAAYVALVVARLLLAVTACSEGRRRRSAPGCDRWFRNGFPSMGVVDRPGVHVLVDGSCRGPRV